MLRLAVITFATLMVAMTSPLHRAAERPFCVCQLLHFCQLLSNSSVDLEFECICGKPMKRRFQRCIVRTEILATFHPRVEYISVTKYTIEIMGANDPQNPPFSLRHVYPHLIHECLGDPTHCTKRQLDLFTHFCTTTQQRPHRLQ